MKTCVILLVLVVWANAKAFDGRRQKVVFPSRAFPAVKKASLPRALENGFKPAKPKLTGGSSAALGQIPFHVSIDSDDSYFCNGAIIHPYYVVTTAYCVEGGSEFTIYAGVVKRHGDESSRVIVKSNETYIHVGRNPHNNDGNIALIKLAEGFRFNEYISAALLPWNDDQFVGDAAWISGFGSQYQGGPLAPVLQYAAVTVISNEDCGKPYGSDMQPSDICTLAVKGLGDCDYDNGGPLFKNIAEGASLLIGLSAFGAGCLNVAPDGFSRVSAYRDWIAGHLQST
ncbi:brachyurin-like [Ischnura elegans]|uniref:brachyurin-like n=1 Tax=Ischnura elegans TaxID=197161 RepID=UPI001ED87877|nr:brachyurin-like [Ischnura elegans]